MANSRAALTVTAMGGDPRAIQAAAVASRSVRLPGPGLTDDAKRVIEAMSSRSLLNRADAEVDDLLVGLAAADCLARPLLTAQGITAVGLVEKLGGHLPQ
jgi:hypothetical protein